LPSVDLISASILAVPLAAVDSVAGVGLVTAFVAGFVSFLSPCVLPIVPGYLSAVSGLSVPELEDANWKKVLTPSLIFVCSFSLIFILLGMGATKVGELLTDNQELLEKISGALIIALGVLFVASFFVTRLNREWHVDALMQRAGKGGPLVAGAAFAFAWPPCIGPALGAILSAASTTDSTAKGALLLAIYSAGLAIPFLLTALAFSRMTTAFAVIKRHYGVVIMIGGLVLIAMGILILTGELSRINIEMQRWAQNLGLNF
jgi:cytochrome c-type biogenesis protein